MAENGESEMESSQIGLSNRRGIDALIISLLFFALTLLVYRPACQNGFVAWDDNHYVYNQPDVLAGLQWKGLLWALTAKVAANWHPLTLISLQCDASLFGTGPFGFHLTSVLLHAVNSGLAFLAVSTLTGCRWKSVFTAGLFALHPMHVESVAWISERKDVLSGLFFFLTLIAYGHYVKAPSAGKYALVTLCFALGLCAKSMLVTVPCVLLLLDDWPLARLRNESLTDAQRFWRLFLEKIPLFVLSVIVCCITILYQKNAIRTLSRLPLDVRIENTAVSYAAYLFQTFWPLNLSPYYARHAISRLSFWGSLGILIIVTGLVVWLRKRRPSALIGWLWFLGMLVPVIGLFQVGHHARADRYMYLPQFGLFLAVIWWVSDIVSPSRWGRVLAGSLGTLILCSCAILTNEQISIWRETRSLFQRAYELDPNNPVATYVLAEMCYTEGNQPEAIRLTRQAIQNEDRSDCETLVMLGMLMADCGEYAECVQALDKALKSHPDDVDVISNRAKALAALGKWQEAADSYRRAAQLSPASTNFQFFLAYALGKSGKHEESQKMSAAALRQMPQWPRNIAAKAWKMSTSPYAGDRGNFWPICLAEQACELTGGNQPEYLDVLAAAYAEAGRFDDATATAKKAIEATENRKNKGYADLIRQRLALYEKHEPFRESFPQANPSK